MDKRFDSLEKYLEAKFPEEANKMILLINTNRAEFIDARDRHENALMVLAEKLDLNFNKITQIDGKVSDKIDGFDKANAEEKEKMLRDREVKAVMDAMLLKLGGK